MVSFLRKASKKEDTLLIVCNFTPASYKSYKVGVPYAGNYKEIFCSDYEKFGGDGSFNTKVCASKRSACDGRRNSITIGLAPLSMSIFKLTKEDAPAESKDKSNEVGIKKNTVDKASRKKTSVKSSSGKKAGVNKTTDRAEKNDSK